MNNRQPMRVLLGKTLSLACFLAAIALAWLGMHTGTVGNLVLGANLLMLVMLLLVPADRFLNKMWIPMAMTSLGVTVLVFSLRRPGGDAAAAVVSDDHARLTEVCDDAKPTIVIFSAEWCGFCKKLEQKTLTDPDVKKRLEKYNVVIVDIDQRKPLARKAHVDSVPTMFAISTTCETVDTLDGYATPEQFLAWLDKVDKEI